MFMACQYPLQTTLGSLGNDDDDGSENVAKKNKFASFQTLPRLFEPAQFVKCRRYLLELNSFAVSKRDSKILGKPCCWHCRYCLCQLFVSYVFKRTGRSVTDNLRCFNSFWVSVLNNNRYGFSTIKKRLFKKWTAERLGGSSVCCCYFCLPVYLLHEVQWIHFYYSIHSSCYHQGWIFWVEHYFCYCLVWRTENINEPKKSLVGSFTRGIPAGNDLRVYSSGALFRSELRSVANFIKILTAGTATNLSEI